MNYGLMKPSVSPGPKGHHPEPWQPKAIMVDGQWVRWGQWMYQPGSSRPGTILFSASMKQRYVVQKDGSLRRIR